MPFQPLFVELMLLKVIPEAAVSPLTYFEVTAKPFLWKPFTDTELSVTLLDVLMSTPPTLGPVLPGPVKVRLLSARPLA
jgi:hypothetical protein